jgi:hypothetical protein
MFNTTNVDSTHRPKPTIEFRYPNGTLDHRQVQTQIIVADAVLHQAGVITNDHELNTLTPKFSERDQHLRMGTRTTPEQLEQFQRKFLDLLQKPHAQEAAMWLFNRSKIE